MTQIMITSDEIEKLVLDTHHQLSNFYEWMRISNLSPNPSKTECMTVGHPRRIKQLVISDVLLLSGTEVKRVPISKALGVSIDESLTGDERFKAV